MYTLQENQHIPPREVLKIIDSKWTDIRGYDSGYVSSQEGNDLGYFGEIPSLNDSHLPRALRAVLLVQFSSLRFGGTFGEALLQNPKAP